MTAVLSPDRVGRITGSRIAGVLGLSPYQSPDDVLRQMVREAHGAPAEFEGNQATAWGNEHEADGIAAYEDHAGYRLLNTGPDQKFVTHPSVPWLGVTPDGVTVQGRPVEVKCPLWGGYTVWQETPWYEVQLRLAIECLGADAGEFVVWRPGGTVISTLERDPWWFDGVLPVLEEFHARYEQTVADPALFGPLCEPLVDVRTDVEWSDAAARFRECAALEKVAAEQLAQARAELLALTDKSASGCGVSVNRTTRKGGIDYKTALASVAPDADVEGYRKAETVVWSVRTT